MDNTTSKRKRKRRLRKEIRYALIVLGVFAVLFLSWKLISAFSSSSTNNPTEPVTSDATDQNQTQTTTPAKNEKITVMIDPGHGGFDPGNTGYDDIYESDINLEIARYVVEDLQNLNPDLNIIMTRDSDEVDWAEDEITDLTHRVDLQILDNVDYNISLHCNAFYDSYVSGFMFYVKPDDIAGLGMATTIGEQLDAIGWSSNQGITTTDNYALQVVHMSPTHSILVEMGYMTNDEDLAGLTDPETQKLIASAIAQGINDYIKANPAAGESRFDHEYTQLLGGGTRENQQNQADQGETESKETNSTSSSSSQDSTSSPSGSSDSSSEETKEQ